MLLSNPQLDVRFLLRISNHIPGRIDAILVRSLNMSLTVHFGCIISISECIQLQSHVLWPDSHRKHTHITQRTAINRMKKEDHLFGELVFSGHYSDTNNAHERSFDVCVLISRWRNKYQLKMIRFRDEYISKQHHHHRTSSAVTSQTNHKIIHHWTNEFRLLLRHRRA